MYNGHSELRDRFALHPGTSLGVHPESASSIAWCHYTTSRAFGKRFRALSLGPADTRGSGARSKILGFFKASTLGVVFSHSV